MTMLFEALTPKAQNALVRDHVIDLVTVVVRAVPDPDRPDDRLAMTIAMELKDEFAPGQPQIDAELARVREICGAAGEDLSVNMQDALLAAANLTAAHAGTPVHDTENDSFSVTIRCHDPNGELYNVTFSRDRVTVQSYSELEA